jgi:hypothetical protein
MLRDLRLLIFVELLGLIYHIVPDDALQTHKWMSQIPFEK